MSAFGSARFINLVYERSEEKMSKQIYLDNAATTQMSDAVKQAMEPYLQENYGNASTAYSIGEDARRELEKSREVIAATLHAKTSENSRAIQSVRNAYLHWHQR